MIFVSFFSLLFETAAETARSSPRRAPMRRSGSDSKLKSLKLHSPQRDLRLKSKRLKVARDKVRVSFVLLVNKWQWPHHYQIGLITCVLSPPHAYSLSYRHSFVLYHLCGHHLLCAQWHLSCDISPLSGCSTNGLLRLSLLKTPITAVAQVYTYVIKSSVEKDE